MLALVENCRKRVFLMLAAVVAVSAALCSSGRAQGLTEITQTLGPPQYSLPFNFNPGRPLDNLLLQFAYRDRLYGHPFYSVDPITGRLRVRFLVTNGHKWRGFTVCFSIVFRSADSSRAMATSFKWGINPRESRDETYSFAVNPDTWRSIAVVDLYWVRCSTNGLWAKLILFGMEQAGQQMLSRE